MAQAEFPQAIKYAYSIAPEATLKTAHGVWGGVNPHGEIELCFYDESAVPPRRTEQAIEPDGSPGPERVVDAGEGRVINRHIHSRLLLSQNAARAVLEWLEDRVADLEASTSNEMYDDNSGLRQ